MKKFLLSFFLLFTFIFNLNFVFAAPNLDNASIFGSSAKSDSFISGTSINKTTDAPKLIQNGINVFLGIFATLLVIIVAYAGIVMITSKGKIESYQTGLKLLKTAIIAMLIVLFAYAISNFVLSNINFLTTNQ